MKATFTNTRKELLKLAQDINPENWIDDAEDGTGQAFQITSALWNTLEYNIGALKDVLACSIFDKDKNAGIKEELSEALDTMQKISPLLDAMSRDNIPGNNAWNQ